MLVWTQVGQEWATIEEAPTSSALCQSLMPVAAHEVLETGTEALDVLVWLG